MTNQTKVPDLESSVITAHSCGEKIDEHIATMGDKTDEEKLVFWSIFFGNSVAIAVKQVSPQTTLIILNSLITAIQHDEINTKFH